MATEKPTILKPKEMYDLCHGDMSRCVFDFSSISIDDFDGLFNTLPQLVYKKVKSLKFCNDTAVKLESGTYDAPDEEIRNYQYSIKNQKPGYSTYISKIISQALPRTKLLTTLEFDRIPLSHESFENITNSIRKCPRIKNVAFSNLRVHDEDFVYFLTHVSPYKLDSIKFVNCQISENVYDSIRKFLNSQPGEGDVLKDGQWRLATLNLDNKEITADNLPSKAASRKSDIKERNISFDDDNDGYEDSENITRSKAEITMARIREVTKAVPPASPTDNPREQNEKLKRELEELLGRLQAVRFSDDVFLIGEGAQESLDDIRAAEETVKKYEEAHGEININ
ncbi:hypothetical protein TRFO_41665 [Tritrichomonas foetus]|uniref:Uncharacterized protein n=1 Tax=Tritrichomonas foetus TaxID=1144522 RepID=A0A1J4L0Q2_9EUKA|nr:hypothetical protein TRFO_41665 [Tritrichomonas foetus]|eukprot:OHT16672.1 hypothetical protein TRFO_41665 [Tritrichomonas foetus]